MKKDLTELVVIIDRSGSMSGLESDVVGGYNSLIEEQKKEVGDVLVTTIFFNEKQKVITDRENIKNIKKLESKDYLPSGCTALLDTIGHAITHLEEIHSHLDDIAKPEHIIFSIMTDGLENSSREYNQSQIKKMIDSKKEKGWDFIFQAANIDAIGEGTKIGINVDDISNFEANKKGMKVCFCSASSAIMKKRKKA